MSSQIEKYREKYNCSKLLIMRGKGIKKPGISVRYTLNRTTTNAISVLYRHVIGFNSNSSLIILILYTIICSCPLSQSNNLNQLKSNSNIKTYNNNSQSSRSLTSAGIGGQSSTDATTSEMPGYVLTGRKITKILNEFFDKGYDKRVRPNYGGPPVEVNVTMHIISISTVSEVQMDFTADFYFRQTWVDPRLRFMATEDIKTLYVGAEVSKRIWLPDTFFGNEKMAYFHEATTPNVFLRIEYTGEVYRSIRLTVTSSCPMKLQYFPMDRQQCTIEIESYGYNVKDITYRWARSTAVEREKTISLPQFDIIRTEQKTRIEELSSGTYLRLVAEIHFARRMGYYLIQIYIPSSLIVVISWVSFWLHRNASPARVQLGVTTVLTMTTLMSSTNAALPKISYVKSIDVFLGTCFVMVFAALLEYATVGYLGKRIAMRKAHAQNVLSHAVAMTQRMIAAQNQANLVSSLNNNNLNNNSNNNDQQTINVSNDGNNHSAGIAVTTTASNYNTNNQVYVPLMGHHHNTNNNNINNNNSCIPKTNTITSANQQINLVPVQANQPQQQSNIVEQFLNTAATLPSLMNSKLEIKQQKPKASTFAATTGARVIDSKLSKGKQLDSIFGVRPSSIDKYSRVVFPVCFVCFQLMYWIVYLHISAFLENESQES